MSTTNERRRFLRLLGLAATGIAASACAEKAQEPLASPATSVPLQRQTPPIATPTVVTQRATRAPAPATGTAATMPSAPAATASTSAAAGLVVARGAGADPAELARRAIAGLGGIERFVKKGANVVIKPNICVAYHGPEFAATTNPDVVAAVVALCKAAGAARVRVMDAPFGGTAANAYDKSGIAQAVGVAGGEMEVMSRMKYRSLPIRNGRTIKSWQAYGDALDADLLINIPIAKDHGSSRLSLGMKNLMGLIQDRNAFHARGLHQCIADLSSALRPHLTIVDAVRVLTANGPTGGNLDDVQQLDTVIASVDPVAADAYAATLFNMAGQDIDYIRLSAEMGLGEIDLNQVKVIQVQV